MTHLLRTIVVTALTALIIWGLSHLSSINNLEWATYDLRQIAFPPATAVSDDVVMIWLDEPTMKALPYRTPIPRDFLAQLTEKLVQAKPKLVGFDIFFKDPSFAEADEKLAKSLKEISAYAVVPRRESGEVDPPLPLFAEMLTGTGLADFPFNPFDATIRETQFVYPTTDGEASSFAATLFEAATGKQALAVVDEAARTARFGLVQLTPYSDALSQRIYLRFAGPPGKVGSAENRFKIYSAQLVAKGLVPAAWLKDKIILVGAGYEDLKDAFLTPYYARFTGFERMNGVEIHAHILSSLLAGQFYATLLIWQKWAVIVAMALIVGWSAAAWSPWRSALLYLIVVAGYAVSAVLLFREQAIVLPFVVPLLSATTAMGLGVAWKALTEGKQKRWIKGVFAHYVPPAVVDRVTENPDLLKLGGEERIVTSFFSDIASFTTISEKLDPTTLVKFLNEYLGKMNDILFRHGATLDKYEGDAIIAFFNAPVDLPQHERAAVRAALEIQQACREVTEAWRAQAGRDIITRIGLNTGRAVVGNMGSESRFDYTAIGDTINLASRLEGTNKFYGTRVMCSEMTAKGLDQEFVLRPIDRVRVKGKTEPILLYDVVDFASALDKAKEQELIVPYLEAYRHFEQRALEKGRQLVKKILEAYPEDGPALSLQERIERAEQDPSWNLVTNLESK